MVDKWEKKLHKIGDIYVPTYPTFMGTKHQPLIDPEVFCLHPRTWSSQMFLRASLPLAKFPWKAGSRRRCATEATDRLAVLFEEGEKGMVVGSDIS